MSGFVGVGCCFGWFCWCFGGFGLGCGFVAFVVWWEEPSKPCCCELCLRWAASQVAALLLAVGVSGRRRGCLSLRSERRGGLLCVWVAVYARGIT